MRAYRMWWLIEALKFIDAEKGPLKFGVNGTFKMDICEIGYYKIWVEIGPMSP